MEAVTALSEKAMVAPELIEDIDENLTEEEKARLVSVLLLSFSFLLLPLQSHCLHDQSTKKICVRNIGPQTPLEARPQVDPVAYIYIPMVLPRPY